MNRASWDETWMSVAGDIALRSPCIRRQAGVVVVDATNRLVATGYNGFPSTRATNPVACHDMGGCDRSRLGVKDPHSYTDCLSIHAEANALLFCDRRDREGGTIYITTNLCWECAKLVCNSGLKRVVMRVDAAYRPVDQVAQLLDECRIELTLWG